MAAALGIAALAAGCGGGDGQLFDELEQGVAGQYCSEPTFSVSRQGPSTQVILSARSTCTVASATYRFLVKPPGATQYGVLRDYPSLDGEAHWDLAGQPAGRYVFQVQVRPDGLPNDYDATATASFLVGDVCATTTVLATVNGTTLDLSASASCGGGATPEYRFWVKPPGATAYTSVRPYAKEAKASYTTGAPGRYEVLVYARAAGSSSDVEASASTAAAVGPACSAATLTQTYDGGGLVELAATAACGGANPALRFLVREPGSASFVEISPYGPADRFSYSAPGPSGRYEFQVWARAQGSLSEWDAQATAATLVGATCSSATLTATYDGSSFVDLRAGATCRSGAAAEFRYLVRRPGATTFLEVEPWGPSGQTGFYAPGFASGRYEFKVYARVPGNLSTYEATATTSVLVGPTCSGATLSATYDGTSRVDLAGGASCPFGGEYRFLARPPGATAFTEIRPYGPEAAFAWDVPPASPGRWELQLQARLPGSPSDFDTSATASTLVGPSCAFAGLNARFDGYSLVELGANATCAGAGATPEYRFFAKRPGETVYNEIRPFGPDSQAPYSVYDLVPGRYDFKVNVRAAGNASDWEATASAGVFIGPTCSGASLSARFDGGSMVELSALSSCTMGVWGEYRLMVRPPGATAFTELRGWSQDGRLQYYVPPGLPGRFEFQVYVRAAGNPSEYEASAKASAFVGPTCSTASLSARFLEPGSTYVDPVLLTASATCGTFGGPSATPEYRFLVRRPGEAYFSQLRGWGSPEAGFRPDPARQGKYEFQVQVRGVGNVSDYEAIASASLFVGGTCSSASLVARSDGYGLVNLASEATCSMGAAPEYRFLVKRPGDVAFTELRPFDPDPAFVYLPTPPTAGRYELQVQVRAVGNASASEATATASSFLGPACTGTSLVARDEGGIRLAAGATCTMGAYPEFRFQVKRPGETAFTDFRPYAPEAEAFYDVWWPQYRPGRYEFQVLARAQGNRSDWEAIAKATVLVGEACSAAGLTAVATPGANVVELTATSACGYAPPEYRFFVKGPGATAFGELQPYGPEAQLPFYLGTGAPAGRYEFQVWARAFGNPSDYEAIASTTVFVGAACSASALTAVVNEYETIELSGSASCRFGMPELRFLARPPGGAFREVAPWSPARGIALNAFPRTFGRWEFQLFVRAAGNVAEESSATASALFGPTCPAVALVALADGGQGMNLTAAGACRWGASPEYRFLLKPPGAAAFVEVQPYGPNPSLQLFRPEAGRFEVQVQVRAQGNPSDYEGQATTTLLTRATCSSVSLTSFRQPNGWVNLEAFATCLGNSPEYRFLYRRAGAPAFTELRRYEPGQFAGWDTTGLPAGAYEVLVQARSLGNASTFEASTTLPVALE